jgi:hypothetical protein
MIASKRNNVSSLSRLRAFVIIGITVIAVLSTGCAEVNYLRDAQSAFSEAARLENTLRTNQSPTIEVDDDQLLLQTEIRSGYASAIASIDSLDSRQIEALKSDKLWGVALTLKAMSLWRLGNYDEMEIVARDANALGTDQIYPRDKAMLLALPGLRRVNEAHALVAAIIEGSEEEKEKIRKDRLDAVERLVKSASNFLATARQSVSSEHSVRSYLIRSELAGYKNLLDGREKFSSGGILSAKEKTKVMELLTELDCVYRRNLDADDLSAARLAVIEPWKVRFGLVGKDLSCKDS